MRLAGRKAVVGTLAFSCLVLMSACSSAAKVPSTSSGSVITFAEQVGAPPNYIFPLLPGAYESNANLYQFDNQLYLPLYWFGDNGKPIFNPNLSVAEPPVFSDHNQVVTITLKHWTWSNGTPITAADVVFWMNLVSAATDPNAPTVTGPNGAAGPGWGGFVPGGFPENVVSYRQTGTYSLSLTLNSSYNPTWYLYNELSQVYPMPKSVWDKLSSNGPVGDYDASAELRVALPGTSPAQYVPQDPGTASSGALGVAQFLNVQSQNMATYATNPLWKVVDGPFTLSQFTPSGYVRLVPNRGYSGAPKPRISAFVELPFTSETSEFDALRSGAVTIGYIPVEDLSQVKSLERQLGYSFAPWRAYGFEYIPYNFTNQTSGPIFSQLYFRQAMQSLVDQSAYIREFLQGYGSVVNGPVPTSVPDPFASSLEAHGQVYPYEPARAVSLLRAHGWKVVPGGTSYCASPGTGPGQCGAGIAANQPANFKMLYSSGTQELTNEMAALQSTMRAKAGIDLTLSQEATADVGATIQNGCSSSKPCNNWDLADVALSFTWTYGPDFLPTGEELFVPGAVDDSGGYSSATNDANVMATNTAPNQAAELAALDRYQNYLAEQLPVLYMPMGVIQLTMYKSSLHGLLPQDPFDIIYPQQYYLG
jgi:peptide/nickel transport system substrate-binding protein